MPFLASSLTFSTRSPKRLSPLVTVMTCGSSTCCLRPALPLTILKFFTRHTSADLFMYTTYGCKRLSLLLRLCEMLSDV